jgi:class 3 adenylate cyclase/tetratricopeptide (TPR) repeat protein
LFTDLEGSTRLWEEHPEAMKVALSRHDVILRDVVGTHGGRVVKTTGDGLHAVFATAPEATAAAVDAQRRLMAEVWTMPEPLRVRMGLHTGNAEMRDGDYFGSAVNRAARVAAVAHGGQVVLTSASATLVRESLPDGLELVDLGLHRLRDLARPERVYQLTIAGLRSEFPSLRSVDAFPSRARGATPSFAPGTEELAGRRVELDSLERAWERAKNGVRRVALVAGEPGIGKTRLVGELARLAYAQDGVVLYGRCEPDAVVPYQPFVEALRPYVAAYSLAVLHERLHGLEQDLTRLFPALLGRTGDGSWSAVSDPEAQRYRLFEAITLLLTGIAAAAPALLVIDDLHWSDQPTLLLLRHVVRSAADAPLLVVVCYRDVELADGQVIADHVADLRREPFTDQVSLEGISEAEAATLLSNLAGHDVAPALTRALHREAGGNPFFLTELLRSLIETDVALVPGPNDAREVDLGALGLPQRVRDVVARRVRRLPEPVNDVLKLASVVGSEFGAPLLARAGQWPVGDVLESLDQARHAGLVDEPTGRRGSYCFSHALIRQALYRELGTAQKAQLHARVGTAMEQQVGSERSAAPATLAEHFTQAAALGMGPKALEYATAAGHDAAAHLAFEDAATYFEQALELHDEYAPDDPAPRVELLISLAEALTCVDETAALDAALHAVDAARASGSPQQFGRAVAVFLEPMSSTMYPDQVATLLDEAQHRLGDDDRALLARLKAIEAFKYSAYQLQGRDGRALADRAVQLAREAGEAPTLTQALFARAISLESTARMTERRALGEELVALGRAGGGSGARATTHGLRVLARVQLELGDAESLTATIADLARTGQERRWLPALVYEAQWRATQALLEGRFDDVRAYWRDMRRYARGYSAVAGIHDSQAYYLAREQGTLADVVGPLEQMSTVSSQSLYVPALLAVAQLDSADETAALHTVDLLTADDIRRSEAENAWGAILGLLSEVAAVGASSSRAELLSELLEPFAGRLLVTVIGLASVGAADRYRGMLSTTLGRWDDAEAHFERALELEEGIRGRALVPRTRYWQARFLQARARPGDDRRARAVLSGVVHDTRELGMRRLSAQAEQALAR